MVAPRLFYGLVATLLGLGLLWMAPAMPGVDCLLRGSGAACGSNPNAIGAALFVAAVGFVSASVGGWNLISAAR